MNAGRWHEIDELFEAALEKTGEARLAFLAGVDPALRPELEQLLAADAGARTFLERRSWLAAAAGGERAAGPAPDAEATALGSAMAGRTDLTEPDRGARGKAAASPDLPKRIGSYKVLGVLGEGGMGRVLLASRADEQYQRLVAIKTLRARPRRSPGLEDPRERRLREELLARFDLERQALAQLEHPNIARLYDAGRDEAGNPYLVLEHVDGVPLDEHCDAQRLGVEDRLRLFLEVCQAVEAAHRNLLVHRDLKPSNILVTRDGRPMLLDFGIAKLLDPGRLGELLGRELFETREGSRPMTPGYASPEQVKGEPITTASDVYSLGVLLYELLTGRKPYRVTSWLPHELERAICEVEPEKPSTAVFRKSGDSGTGTAFGALAPDEVARRRATSPQALARLLRGDLDTLLQKALRKDPDERYTSVEAMSQDVRAYLGGRPLAARPPSAFYALGKFVRRHRFGVAAAALLAGLLVVFLAARAVKTRQIRAERDTAQQTLAFLIEVFKHSDPQHARGQDLSARDVLGGAARRIEVELEDQPEIQATLMDAMGQIYSGLGLYRDAGELFAQSLERRRRELGESHAATLAAQRGQAGALLELGAYEAARELFAAAVARHSASGAGPAELAEAQLGLGDALHQLGRAKEAIRNKEAAVALLSTELRAAERRAAPLQGEASREPAQLRELEADLASAELSLGISLVVAQDPAAAAPLYASAEARRRRLFGDDSRETAELLFRRGELARGESRDRDAIPLLEEAIRIERRLLDAGHPKLLASLEVLAQCRSYVGQVSQSVPLYEEILEQRKRRLGPRHLDVARTLTSLGTSWLQLEKFAEAGAALEEALAIRRDGLGNWHALVANTLCRRADVRREMKQLDAAAADCREAITIQQSIEGSEVELEGGLLCLGQVELARGDFAAAATSLRRVYEGRKARLEPGVDLLVNAEIAYGCTLGGLDRQAEAEGLLRSAYAALAARNPQSARAEKALDCLAPIARALGRADAGKIQGFLEDSRRRGPL